MFFRRKQNLAPAQRAPVSTQLAALVRAHMPDADAEDVAITTAIAGLLAGVAYADHQYLEAERVRIREDLGRMQTLPGEGIEAICQLLDEDIVELATGNQQQFTRTLRELVDVSLRREVLDVLVDLAASDDEITLAETDHLRRTTASLGLGPEDYQASQKRHADRITVLR